MKDRLRARMPNSSDAEIDAIFSVLERYNLKPVVDNLDEHGFIFKDLRGRTVRACVVKQHDRIMYIPVPHADVTIVVADGMLTGWVESAKLEDLEDRCCVDVKSLTPMPAVFSFDQVCSHLVDHGGFFEGDGFWTCFGCGQKLIFNDEKRGK